MEIRAVPIAAPNAAGGKTTAKPEPSPVSAATTPTNNPDTDSESLAEALEEMKSADTDYLILRTLLGADDDEIGEGRDVLQLSASYSDIDLALLSYGDDVGTRLAAEIEMERLRMEGELFTDADGDVHISFNGITYERTVVNVSMTQQEEDVQVSDPLALDLDGDGLEVTGVENGRAFDLDGDGTTDKASFVTGGDAFLAVDKNGNGKIDNGHELFGDQGGAKNGFEALSAYDDNNDGWIDAKDAIFNDLRTFTIDEAGKQHLKTMDEAGIKGISTGYSNTGQKLNRYDSIAQVGSFKRVDDSIGLAGDLLLGRTSNA